MTPTTLPLKMRRNEDPLRLRFNISDDSGPLDMSTGYSAKMQVRPYAGATGTPVAEALSSSAAGTRIVLEQGGFDLVVYRTSIVAAPSTPLPQNDAIFFYDILITEPSGDTSAWYAGTFTLQAGVTIA